MSWGDYTNRMRDQKVDKCAVHSRNDGAAWAQVDDFKCTQDEVCCLTQAITCKDKSIFGTGAKMGGKKWTVIRMEDDDDVVVLKGKEPDNSKQTMVVALGNQTVVIGTSSDESLQGNAVRVVVQGVRDYLKQQQY